MIEIQIRNEAGRVIPIRCQEIVTIDGHPFQGTAADFRDALVHLEGRVCAIERILGNHGVEDRDDG